MFIVRRLVFFLAIPVILFVVASVVVESFAETQLASGMRRTLELEETPTVQIEAFPILYHVVQGRIPRVRVEAAGVVIEGLEIAELALDMHGVKTSITTLVRRNRFDLSIEQGEATAQIAQAAVNAFLAREKVDAVATLRDDGRVTVVNDEVIAGTRHRFAATGRLTLGGRVLTFKPDQVTMDGAPVPAALRSRARRETTFSVEIPKLPINILPTEVAVRAGRMTLTATLDDTKLEIR